jgi:hypothetical protein
MKVIEEANKVLRTFAPYLRFISGPRLWLRYYDYRATVHSVKVEVAKNSGSLMHYHKFGIGGTSAMAVGQLARWIRGQSRVPIAAWEYWASPTIMLGGDNRILMLQSIKESSYDDGKSTKCVLCGGDKCSDWWSLNGVIGPCCMFGRCKEMRQ